MSQSAARHRNIGSCSFHIIYGGLHTAKIKSERGLKKILKETYQILCNWSLCFI